MKAVRTGKIQEFIRHLNTAISAVSLYSAGHHQVRRICSLTLSNLDDAMGGGEELSLMVIDNELIVDGIPLGDSLHLDGFARTLASRGIGHIRITRGVKPEEILAMVESLSKQNSRHEIISSANIRYGKVEVRFSYDRNCGETEDPAQDRPCTVSTAEDIAKYAEICEGIRKHKKLKVTGIMEIVAGFIATVKNQADPLLALAPLRTADEYTFTHSTNVCILNLAQAMVLGIDGPQLNDIGIAAMLHDVGKFLIPEEVLNKPGSLDDAEWEIMRQHPLKGARYLLDTPGVPHLAVITAYEHHIKHDFTGYPGVSGQWRQSLCSQMTTVSDCFDAARTRRPYRGPMEMEDISRFMLHGAGTHFHPALARNFLKIITGIPGAR